jgi:tetratricopeptide (TPR) repeat protein
MYRCAIAAMLVVIAPALRGQDDAVLKSQRAKKAMLDRRFDEAVQLYSELSRSMPQNPGMRFNLGMALHSAGRYREAIECFDAVLKMQPGLTAARIFTGVAYLKLGDPARAIPPLNKAVAAEPENRIARLELADALLSTSRFDQAAGHFRKLAEIDAREPKAWQGLGLSYLGLARESLVRLETRAPDSAFVPALLARSRAEQQQYGSAFSLYKDALARERNLRGAHAALAEIYRHTGHADWALVEERRERELPPPDCSAASAECAFIKGRYHDAIQAADTPRALYWKALSYSELAAQSFAKLAELPPSAQIHELMAEAHRIDGKYAQAAKELRAALQLDPASVRLKMLLAEVLYLQRDYEAARPLFEELLASDPNSAKLSFELGDLLLQQAEPEKALAWLERAVKIDRNLLSAQDSLGRAYLRTGDARKAIDHLKAALPTDQDGSIHFQLSRAYERAGNAPMARDALAKFQAMSRASAAKRKALDAERQITAP